MCVTVSLKIDLDATATLSQMESQIEEAGRAAMKAALKQAIQAAEAQQTAARGVEASSSTPREQSAGCC